MPELPEVETIRGYLLHGRPGSPPVLGKEITAVHLLWERTLAVPSPAEFQIRLVGQAIIDIGRRGKFMIFRLTSGDSLFVHLRMSGDLVVREIASGLEPHDRLALDFADGTRLAFNDTRKFGRAWLVSDELEIVSGLGPEPLDPDFTPEEFYRRLQARRRQLKPLLLDQGFVAGLGNIYTDEALHLAHLHPLALSDHVSPEQAHRLWESIRRVLEEGILRQGASIDWVYRGGDFQNYFRAYQKAGKPCPECGTPIERIFVGQRSTHYCPYCQFLISKIENDESE